MIGIPMYSILPNVEIKNSVMSIVVLAFIFLLIIVVVEITSILVVDSMVNVNDPKRTQYQIAAITVGIVISALIGGLIYYLVNRRNQATATLNSLTTPRQSLSPVQPVQPSPEITPADIDKLVELSRTIR